MTERALVERVPYGPPGGRERGPAPLWAALLGGWLNCAGGVNAAAALTEEWCPEELHQVNTRTPFSLSAATFLLCYGHTQR